MKAFMEAGVPIGSEAGKVYFSVKGYHLPAVMFTKDDASAMMMAGKLVDRMTDQSVRIAFNGALLEIKSLLNEAEKDHLESLRNHIEVLRPPTGLPAEQGGILADLQRSIASKLVIILAYFSNN
jgi:predicted DNA-binding transcriptional regulator YafY